MSSPTQRSKKLMEDDGYLVAIVERWNPYARIRQDLFGLFDLLGVGGPLGTLAVQTTSASNIAARVRKISDDDGMVFCRRANWAIHVHGWRKNKAGRWECRTVDLS